MSQKKRLESDSLGELAVPVEAYYGIQALRASLNFPISGLKLPAEMIRALAFIKKAAAKANFSAGRLEQDRAAAIMTACDEVSDGKYDDQFIVDVFQMGAGTSFHMNGNEIIANRAEEIMGGKRGDYTLVHPHDHVNMGQSTNDVFPTAMRLSVLLRLEEDLIPALKRIEGSFRDKALEFDGILKSGRTHLQDAAPIRLGQEFAAYAHGLAKGRVFLEGAASSLYELGIGGSAVGTGMNTTPGYAGEVVANLAELTGFPLKSAGDLREAMQSMRPLVEVSSALRNLAVEMTRISNDLRLLSSGPRTGLAEITLPPVAPGSSIMPGKVNPSMLEMMNMVCFQVLGCDQTVTGAAQAGQLELNVMMPVIAFDLLFMIKIFSNALEQVRSKCIEGITADPRRCGRYAEESLGLATALSPYVGYAKAAEIAGQALREGKTLVRVLRSHDLLNEEQIAAILDPARMTEARVPGSDKDDDSN